MTRLADKDFRAILEFVRGAYGVHSLDAYMRHVTTGLTRLIGANYVSYNEVDLRRGHNVPFVDPPEAVRFRGYTDGIFDRHLAEHPVVNHFVRTGDLAAMRMSDFVSQRQFHALGLYQEFFRHVRTEYQLAAGVVAEPGLLIDIGLNRTRPDFTTRDQLVLNTVRGHLADAHRNVRRLSAIEGDVGLVLQGADDVDAGIVMLGPDGRIQVASAVAHRCIAQYFGPARAMSGRLPRALAAWVGREERSLGEHRRVAMRRRPLVVERADRRLVIRLLVAPDRLLLVLTEELLEVDPRLLDPLGLSRREAEVLACVAKGKTDAEVAAIIGTRPRTVGKHLERIYQKLGVDNRTAAASRALEVIARRLRHAAAASRTEP